MNGLELSDYELPEPDRTLPPLNENAEQASEAAQIAAAWEQLEEAIPRLNHGQRLVFNEIVGTVEDGLNSENIQPMQVPDSPYVQDMLNMNNLEEPDFSRPRCFLLNAAGGTGKTFLINAIQNCMKVRRKNAIAVATSAVAAKLLKKGRTAHSTFRIPVPCGSEDTCFIEVHSDEAK